MEKSRIKAILRESLTPHITEEGGQPQTHSGHEEGKKQNTDYAEIQRKLDGTMLKASQVMAAAGLGDANNATDRSLFSKKLRQERNEDGGLYSFSQEELASLVKVINNPVSYLSVKNK